MKILPWNTRITGRNCLIRLNGNRTSCVNIPLLSEGLTIDCRIGAITAVFTKYPISEEDLFLAIRTPTLIAWLSTFLHPNTNSLRLIRYNYYYEVSNSTRKGSLIGVDNRDMLCTRSSNWYVNNWGSTNVQESKMRKYILSTFTISLLHCPPIQEKTSNKRRRAQTKLRVEILSRQDKVHCWGATINVVDDEETTRCGY